ncbi:MAG TPA: hypothetical protein DEH78_09445 [Solibacterales bacterium]|nr:hypothetical protein [Bryobacterales bacterium]
MTALSRRSWFAWLAAALLLRPVRLAASLSHQARRRRYRADAVITFLGIPIYSREDVGGGYAVFEETKVEGGRRLSIEFAGGSRPERARGLNRLGFIRETVWERGGRLEEARYFGFMTSSPEQDFDQAKKALAAQQGSLPYSAVDGLAAQGRMVSAKARLLFPPTYSFARHRELIGEVERIFPENRQAPVETETGSGTFLYALSQAMAAPLSRFACDYAWNGKLYELRVEKNREKSGQWRLKGRVAERGAKGGAAFRLWYDDGPGPVLPSKIEFDARSFLKLSFVAAGEEAA